MHLLLLVLILLLGCSDPANEVGSTAGNETARGEPQPSEPQPSEPQPEEPPERVRIAAEQLAQDVAAYAGNPYGVTALTFTFSVVENDETRVSRQHIWCPGEGLAQVTTNEGVTSTDLRSAPGTPEQDSPAYGQFINDSFWLLAPTKVTDPGVSVGLEDEDLTLAFEGVGLTPGDRYWLSLASDHRVEAWRFELQGGQTGAYAFLEEQTFGPLRISTLRRSESGREVRFTEISILDACPLHR